MKIKLHGNPESEKSYMYELKIDFFDNGNPEYFLFLVQNFNKVLEILGTLAANNKLQYLCTLLSGKALWDFYTLWLQIGSMTVTCLNQVVLGVCTYFSSVSAFSEK